MEGDVSEYVDLVARRADVMSAIEDERLDLRAIQDGTGASRSTVNRAIRSLEDTGLVERVGGEYTLTAAGRLALEHHRTYRDLWADLIDAREVLDALPRDAPIDIAFLAGAEATVPPEEAPYRPIQRLQEEIAGADRYRGVLPALPDPRGIRLLYEHVTTDGKPAELIVSEQLRASLLEGFPRRLPAMAESDAFELYVGEVPPFGLVLTDSGEETTATLIAFGDSGSAEGVVRNDTEAAVRWAEKRYARLEEAADPATDADRQAPDGGATDLAPGNGPGRDAPGLPVSLERQGFVRVDRSHLIDREVADPTTAWRAGLDLAEVHTGYAVERTDGNGVPLADRLFDELDAGGAVALVGPPGSGKSTTAKRVASEWYTGDRGPVFYREGGRGAAFEDVDALVAAVGESEGHALVVVEDAVRPDAAAVFDAVDRLADREDVSVLLDARDREWQDPPDGSAPNPPNVGIRVEHMPRLDDAEYERLIERFERTVGVDVDLPVERLREEVRSELSAEDDAAPGELLLVLHRLSTYADPLADGQTGLEEAAAALYEDLADRGSAVLDVAVAANLLNAAGVPLDPGHLRAAAGDCGDAPDAFEAAVEVLDGRVLFKAENGAYRTVHESWSAAFLDALLDREAEAAARERVARVVSRVLSLADGADADTDALPRRAHTDPSSWADETIERLFTAGLERPKLAALFGDEEGPSIEVPAVCESVTEADCTLWFGEMCLDRGAHEWAEAAFDSLPADGEYHLRRLLGLTRAARIAGDPARAGERAETAVAAARDAGDREAEATGLRYLGNAAFDQGEYGRAREYYEESTDIAREGDDRSAVSEALNGLGQVCYRRGKTDRACELYERALEIKEALGDRNGAAMILNNLGLLATETGDVDRARSCFSRSVRTHRELGDPRGEARPLGNLGILERRLNRYERAAEHFEAQRSIYAETGDSMGEALALGNLGNVARDRGRYGRAQEYYREALSIARDAGIRRVQVGLLVGMGFVAFGRGDYEQASEYHRESMELNGEVGDEAARAEARLGLGQVALAEGDHESAREMAEQARAIYADTGDSREEARALRLLGCIAADRGETGTATERLETAAEQFETVGSVIDALDTLEELADIEADAGDGEGVREACERALGLIDGADPVYDLADRRGEFEARLTDPLGGAADRCRGRTDERWVVEADE